MAETAIIYVRRKSGYTLRVFQLQSRQYVHFSSFVVRVPRLLMGTIASAAFWPKDVVFAVPGHHAADDSDVGDGETSERDRTTRTSSFVVALQDGVYELHLYTSGTREVYARECPCAQNAPSGQALIVSFCPSVRPFNLQVVGPCARSVRIATTILLANPAVKQQCLHCCVSAWRADFHNRSFAYTLPRDL
ncbi:hypothetical protein MSG28_002014 [Choristoneura fumiferana]|uniref:Uncharacterized protein n=1 Tax=Choristoneura fumiferana TaxID=7141 RepID=A0ACC0JTH2_CHOFU|nr:hypothetical protein MSG28_002014 [Choristoneura fumiferana]